MYRGLMERLEQGAVICAEGYLFELERRGYLQAGSFVPEVALENPEVLLQVHRDFLHAGSDVMVAFTYNGHREKLRILGKEDLLEPLNRQALHLAKTAAKEAEKLPGNERALTAGNISNTNIYKPDDTQSAKTVRTMFDEMAGWAADAGADYMIAETFYYHGEARLGLEAIKAAGLPAVVTHGLMAENVLWDGMSVEESCRRLEDMGADVVGMNCFRGPRTMMPYIRAIRGSVRGPVAALPVTYRTTDEHPTFFNLPDPGNTASLPLQTTFPTALDSLAATRYELAEWAREAYDLGVAYLGICCGNTPAHTRALAEALGRSTPASRYSPDMSKQFLFGDDPALAQHIAGRSKKA